MYDNSSPCQSIYNDKKEYLTTKSSYQAVVLGLFRLLSIDFKHIDTLCFIVRMTLYLLIQFPAQKERKTYIRIRNGYNPFTTQSVYFSVWRKYHPQYILYKHVDLTRICILSHRGVHTVIVELWERPTETLDNVVTFLDLV